jgi:murein DD-endopeptidase MepM/ murein hydrolase activator NlpD
MLKIYYLYDPRQCAFVPVTYGFSIAIRKILMLTTAGFLTAVSVLTILLVYFPDKLNRRIVIENQAHKTEWAELSAQLQVMQQELNRLEKQDDQHFRVALNMEKLGPDIRKAGIGGHQEFNLGESENIPGIYQAFRTLTNLKSRTRLQNESFREISRSVSATEEMLASRPAIQPIDNRQLTRFHPLFGMRQHPVYGDWRHHNGLDLTAATGTPVYSTGDGIVTSAEYRGGYGNAIFINHGYGFETRYAHLSGFKVTAGQKVKRGELIGLVGSTGTSTGSHLHYEVLFREKWINPIHFMYRDLQQSAYNEIIREAKK